MYEKGNKMNHTKPDFKEFLYKIAQWSKWSRCKTYSRYSAVSLEKTFHGTFPYLMVLTSNSKFQ